MYLNTQSGLLPALAAVGDTIADRAKFQQRQQGYADAGILPQGSSSPGLFGSGPLSALGLGGSSSGGGMLAQLFGSGGPQSSTPGAVASGPPDVRGQAATPSAPAHYAPTVGLQRPTDTAQPTAAPAPSTSPLTGFQTLIDKANTTYSLPAGYLPRVAAIESKSTRVRLARPARRGCSASPRERLRNTA